MEEGCTADAAVIASEEVVELSALEEEEGAAYGFVALVLLLFAYGLFTLGGCIPEAVIVVFRLLFGSTTVSLWLMLLSFFAIAIRLPCTKSRISCADAFRRLPHMTHRGAGAV